MPELAAGRQVDGPVSASTRPNFVKHKVGHPGRPGTAPFATAMKEQSKTNVSPSMAMSPRQLDLEGGVLPPDKHFGEFSELGSNYEGSHRPARRGLQRVLEQGKMRNPLQMQQSAGAMQWSSRRPLSASSTSSGPRQGQRALSAGRIKPPSRDQHLAGPNVGPPAPLPANLNLPSSQQLDKAPSMLRPQRIELPSYLHTPERVLDGEPLAPEHKNSMIRRIQDLELLVFACRRASKIREEGRAHFSLGVLRDNLGQYQKAIDCYNQFLRVCKECNDGQGCALAYHCIAVAYQLLGEDSGIASGTSDVKEKSKSESQGQAKPEMLRKAVFFHNKHRECSDSVGKFVAHLNMGLAFASLGEKESSTVSHQYALRYALQLRSLEGQSLAIGSLSFSAGMYDNDPEKIRALIERYVELCVTLKQPRNHTSALKKLGILASQQGDSNQSIDFFQQAIQCARAQGDHQAEKDCSVRLGIAMGQAKMSEHLSGILQQSVLEGCKRAQPA